MRVVYLNSTGAIGGAERALLDILAALRAAEPDWELHLLSGTGGALLDEAGKLGVEVRVLPLPRVVATAGDAAVERSSAGRVIALAGTLLAAPDSIAYALRLRRVLRDLDPAIIHSNGQKMHLLGAWAKPARAILIWHLHDFIGTRALMSRLLRAHVGRCRLAIANSNAVADDARVVLGSRCAVRTMYNAVDLDRNSPKGPLADLDTLARMPRVAEGTIRVGLVATFARWKGHETFLKAISCMSDRVPIRGYIVGGAVYERASSQYSLTELHEIAADCGVSRSVGFTGFVPDSATAMRALDIVVHASTRPEPFGLVIIESMACGRATIVSGAGGALELIRDEEDAMTHPPGDWRELASRIEELAMDPVKRQEMGRAARAAVERRFHPSRLAGELSSLYRTALRT